MRTLAFLLLGCAVWHPRQALSEWVIAYDGKSVYSKVELSEYVEFKEFTMSVWFKMKRKMSFGHLPQCLFAKGNWAGDTPRETTIAAFVTPESRVVLTLDLKRGKEIVCELDGERLQYSRWYHFAFDYSATGVINAYLNGIATAVSCTFNGTNRINLFDGDNFLMKRIGHVPTGSLGYDIIDNEKLYMTIGSCSHRDQGLTPEDYLFSGLISNFTLYNFVLGENSIRALVQNWELHERRNAVFTEPAIVNSKGLDYGSTNHKRLVQGIHHLSPTRALISSEWTIWGVGATAVDPKFGDCVLSVMLTVAQTKLNLGVDVAVPLLGSLSSMTDNSEVVNCALEDTLSRHFRVHEEEERVWTSLNKYSTRLEMLGHAVSLLLKEKGTSSYADETDANAKVESRNKSGHTRPVVALVVPATSRGTPLTALAELPLLRALLPSLYATRSAEYDYRVYLVVNQADKVFGDKQLVQLIFDMAKKAWVQSSSGTLSGGVQHELVIVPNSMTPKHALSALFNHGALRAYYDNCDYFYLVNDDLLLISGGWTEIFTTALLQNPILSGLGVAGGVDISDSITPQIEFPFFHRTHVDIFFWCGANPWTFSNWWEDNWLTDIYLPFQAVHYDSRVLLSNYVGIDRQTFDSPDNSVEEVSVGSLDPRYSVLEGRRTPDFYVTEVERGRELILSSAIDKLKKNQGSAVPTSETPIELLEGVNISYCHFFHDTKGNLVKPTLARMPMSPHEAPLNPCNSHLETADDKLGHFRHSVHQTEMPHHSYAELIEKESVAALKTKQDSEIHDRRNICQCPVDRAGDITRNVNCRSEFNSSCVEKSLGISVNDLSANRGFLIDPPLSQGELCINRKKNDTIPGRKNGAAGNVSWEFDSCSRTNSLNVLIIHNHCPLFTRYGSDKRLFHIAETFRGLGYTVHFGGMEVSGLETEDDHLRVKSLGAKLFSPLVTRSESDIYVDPLKLDEMLGTVQPDIVLLTLWFWNVSPAAAMFLQPIRDTLPGAKIIVVSDDAHTLREEAMLQKKKFASRIQSSNAIFAKVKIANVFKIEYSVYHSADAVITITDKDRARILATQENPDRYEFLGETQNDIRIHKDKLKTVRYALSDSEITLNVPNFESRENCVVFVGNGANPVNVDSMKWFFEVIFPIILRDLPHLNISLKIVGADWLAFVQSYPEHLAHVHITGLLRQALVTDILHTCRVFVSPITDVSTGLNTKNVLALSRGIPLVTTVTGADGLHYDEADSSMTSPPFSVAASAASFIKQTEALIVNATLWAKSSKSALNHASHYFSLSAQARDIEEAVRIAFSPR